MRRSGARQLTDLMAGAVSRAVHLGNSNLLLTFKPDELYRVPTDDGSSIALGRYHPRIPRRFAEPVILAHGLGANRFNMDFDERYSLARFLARRGFETWVLELRGRGLAGSPIEATFDDQAEFDVRAAIRAVRSTGATHLTWVGHSKGGLLAYAHIARNPTAPIRALVTLGTPGTFEVQLGIRRFLRTITPLLRLRIIPASRLSAIAPLGAPPGPISRYLMSEQNIEPEILRRAIANIPADISGGVARQFVRWILQGTFDSNDGSFNYRKNMSAVTMPVLLIAGSRDLMAPPLAVARTEQFLGGPVELFVAGTSHGSSVDYGHADLIIGKRAPEEIFPKVAAFLERHSTPAP